MDDFTLTIELGNAAMQSPDDIADALRNIADRMECGQTEGIVRDLNGNTVGRYVMPIGGPKERLEELREILREERISYGELAELADLADHISADDTELLEAAGVPEHGEDE